MDIQNISAFDNYFLPDDSCCNRAQTIFYMFPGELFALFASLVVSGLASALKIFNFAGKALYYGKRGDALKREYYLYVAADGEYSKVEDREQLFVRRIEVILQRSSDEAESVYYPEFQTSHAKEI